jgi:hypothetical protein
MFVEAMAREAVGVRAKVVVCELVTGAEYRAILETLG